MLDINETFGRDEMAGPNWGRVLELYADQKRFEEIHGEPTAEAVLAFYILDRDNPGSIRSCTRAARENARSVRHLISTEMWRHINVFNSRIAALEKRDAVVSNVSRLASETISGCQGFEGIAEGTFLRGEPWCFYQIGKYLERADQTTRILDIGYDRLAPAETDAVAWVHWNVLLRSVSGYHAYRSRHPGNSSPQDFAVFLLYDDEFPRAVSLCLNRLTERIRDIETRHSTRRAEQLEGVRRGLEFLIETGPGKELTSRRLHTYLDSIQTGLADLSSAIGGTYFLGR